MLNLNPEYLKAIKDLLAKHVSGMTVWAYGSRVSGESHEGSDLDLVVINPSGEAVPEENLFALRNALQESDLPILIDVLDWAKLPESFQKQIKKSYLPIKN